MPDRNPDFDPRFDPRFQPGYDPAAHAEPGVRPRHAPGEASATEDDEVPIFDVDDLASGGRLDREERETQDAATAASHSETVLLLRNPFLWLIVVLGAALVGWALYSYSAALELSGLFFTGGFGNDEETQAEYVASQFSLGLAPFALAAGLLALLGVVFFAAVTWRRARTARR